MFILEHCFVCLFDVGFVCGDWLRLRKMGKIIVTQPFYSCRYYNPRAVAAQARPASALAPPNLVGFVRAKSALGFDLGHPRVRFAKTGRFLTDRLFVAGRVHATAGGSKIGLPVNDRKNTGDFSTERRVTDPSAERARAKLAWVRLAEILRAQHAPRSCPTLDGCFGTVPHRAASLPWMVLALF